MKHAFVGITALYFFGVFNITSAQTDAGGSFIGSIVVKNDSGITKFPIIPQGQDQYFDFSNRSQPISLITRDNNTLLSFFNGSSCYHVLLDSNYHLQRYLTHFDGRFFSDHRLAMAAVEGDDGTLATLLTDEKRKEFGILSFDGGLENVKKKPSVLKIGTELLMVAFADSGAFKVATIDKDRDVVNFYSVPMDGRASKRSYHFYKRKDEESFHPLYTQVDYYKTNGSPVFIDRCFTSYNEASSPIKYYKKDNIFMCTTDYQGNFLYTIDLKTGQTSYKRLSIDGEGTPSISNSFIDVDKKRIFLIANYGSSTYVQVKDILTGRILKSFSFEKNVPFDFSNSEIYYLKNNVMYTNATGDKSQGPAVTLSYLKEHIAIAVNRYPGNDNLELTLGGQVSPAIIPPFVVGSGVPINEVTSKRSPKMAMMRSMMNDATLEKSRGKVSMPWNKIAGPVEFISQAIPKNGFLIKSGYHFLFGTFNGALHQCALRVIN